MWVIRISIALLALILSQTDRVSAQGEPSSSVLYYLPLVHYAAPPCPTAPTVQFAVVPVLPPPTDKPAAQHADLNLGLRSATPVSAQLALIDYGGATDPDAPQLPGLFGDSRTADFGSAGQVFDWDWECAQPEGCRGLPLTVPEVTLLGLRTTPGEALYIPSRRPEIYGGGYKALVLYAEERRLTLKYTREDNVVSGYTIHLEDLCVDPGLLAAYNQSDQQGRGNLPALRNGEKLGVALSDTVLVAVRDSGAFLDPRSRKDWWQGR